MQRLQEGLHVVIPFQDTYLWNGTHIVLTVKEDSRWKKIIKLKQELKIVINHFSQFN